VIKKTKAIKKVAIEATFIFQMMRCLYDHRMKLCKVSSHKNADASPHCIGGNTM